MAATLKEIAKEAGVSVSLVSRLFRQDPTLIIRPGTRKAILDARNRLGGVCRRRIRGAPRCNIVLPLNRLTSWESRMYGGGSMRYIIRGAEEFLAKHNGRLSISTFEDAEKTAFFRDLCASPDYCNGILFGDGLDKSVADFVLESKFPHVSFAWQAELLGVNTVNIHTLCGFRQALNHLRDMGHTRIGWLGPRTHRYPLFVSVMTEFNFAVNEYYHCFINPVGNVVDISNAWRLESVEKFGQWICRADRPTAMICHNDMCAIGAMEIIRKSGMEPGRDLSLVGLDNIEDRETWRGNKPGLTTISNPLELVGSRAAALLFEQLSKGTVEMIHEFIAVQLIVRQTTGPAQRDKTQKMPA